MLQSLHNFINLSCRFFSVAKNKNTSKMSSTIKLVLIDVAGNLQIGNKAVPGAVEALNRLRKTNLTIKFVTNTTTESRKSLYQSLKSLGFQLDENEVYTSLWAVRDFIEKEKLKPLFILNEKAFQDFPGYNYEKPDSVVVGLAPERLNRATLNKALRIILKGGILVAPSSTKYFKREDGLAIGTGPFIKALEYATNTKAVVLGKPSADFFRAALDKVPPTEAVMIGDDVKSDIFGAQLIGIRGYLVKTGKYRVGDEAQIEPPPYKVVDSFTVAVDDIISTLR